MWRKVGTSDGKKENITLESKILLPFFYSFHRNKTI